MFGCFAAATLVSSLFAIDSAAAQTSEGETVVARVDGEPVTFNQVKRTAMAAVQGKPVALDVLPTLQAQSLEQAINRRLVLKFLKDKKYEPTADELKTADETFDTNLGLNGVTREDYLRKNLLSDQDLDDLRYWDICWNRYAREQLNEEALERFFTAHRRDYDGTELRVAHILFRIEGTGPQRDAAATLQFAQQVRDDITSGKIKFADAATKYSVGPSRERGGDLGFIPRHERMVEEFSTAAFKLAKGEVSPPIATSFGIHLITVLDERPGILSWTSVRERLMPAAQNDLFRRTAAELRKTARVEYTNLVPHFDPATGKIVVPTGENK
jgi:parvulin-like peptidyl-prolyl isomerase